MALWDVWTMLPQGVHSHVPPFERLVVMSYPIACFFGESFTWTWVWFLFNKCSFGYCVNMYLHMCGSKGRHLVINSSYHTIFFCLSLVHVFTTLRTRLDLPHPTVAHLSRCQCGHTIDDLNTHLLWCPCGNEHTTHDTL